MAITREEAVEKQAEVDAPDVLALLKTALNAFLQAAREEGFQAPLNVTVRDSDFDVLRQFRIEPDGTFVLGKTDGATKLFLLPLVLFLIDGHGRVARLRVGATRLIEQTEFLN